MRTELVRVGMLQVLDWAPDLVVVVIGSGSRWFSFFGERSLEGTDRGTVAVGSGEIWNTYKELDIREKKKNQKRG